MSGKDKPGGQSFPRIGEVYLMNFEGYGSAQSGLRPGIVFQNNIGNQHSPNIIALPLTSTIKKLNQPTHVLIKASESGLKYDSMVLCENPQCIAKDKLGRYITTLSREIMRKVAVGHMYATGALSLLDLNTLIGAWQDAAHANQAYA